MDLWQDGVTQESVTYPLEDLMQAARVPYSVGALGAVTLGLLLRTHNGRAPL